MANWQVWLRCLGEAVWYQTPRLLVGMLPFGERLLRNEADWLDANPPVRWVGGVRIEPKGRFNWRFPISI